MYVSKNLSPKTFDRAIVSAFGKQTIDPRTKKKIKTKVNEDDFGGDAFELT